MFASSDLNAEPRSDDDYIVKSQTVVFRSRSCPNNIRDCLSSGNLCVKLMTEHTHHTHNLCRWYITDSSDLCTQHWLLSFLIMLQTTITSALHLHMKALTSRCCVTSCIAKSVCTYACLLLMWAEAKSRCHVLLPVDWVQHDQLQAVQAAYAQKQHPWESTFVRNSIAAMRQDASRFA